MGKQHAVGFAQEILRQSLRQGVVQSRVAPARASPQVAVPQTLCFRHRHIKRDGLRVVGVLQLRQTRPRLCQCAPAMFDCQAVQHDAAGNRARR